jgi:hypothetical protein
MKRTTIFLPDEVHERLRREAFAARISMAQLIRSRLEQGTARQRTRGGDPLAKVEGIVQDGHLTEGIDDALYSS